MDENEYSFVQIINASIEAQVVAEGDQWLIVRLLDDVYEIVFADCDFSYSLTPLLEASIELVKLGLGPKQAIHTLPYRCENNKITFTLVTK